MVIKIEKKFSEQQLDNFIHDIFQNYKLDPKDDYHFDLTETEWISNQGLLLFTGLLKYFVEKKIQFEVLFIKRGTPTKDVPKRVALQIIQIWETWGIWKIIPSNEYRKHLGINDSTIKALKKQFNISFTRPVIYDDFEITPFVCLDHIKSYDDDIIIERLNDYHALNNATVQIIDDNDCAHPFVNELFGEIISREIFENFLSHYDSTFFNSSKDYAFFSLVLRGKIREEFNDKIAIQNKLKRNFDTEELPESHEFFISQKTNEYKNQSYISYSFFDFGKGIVESLREEFEKNKKEHQSNSDSEIIKYAFRHDSSRNPITNVFEKIEIVDFIPRGLFDVLSLVQRYSGLLIVRSCYGKVLYNFGKSSNIEEAFSKFGNENLFFPGTFITLYLPAMNNVNKIDESVIKPGFQIPEYKKLKERYISLYKLIETTRLKKGVNNYSYLFDELNELFKKDENTLTYFSLENITDKQLIKKTIFFLVARYEINTSTNIVIFHPPKKEFLDELNFEIFSLSNVYVNYKIHPLPFVYFESKDESLELYWLGVFDKEDKNVLDNLLFEQFSVAKSDFNKPDSVIGHLNFFDKHNNLESNFPNRSEIIEFYKKGELSLRIKEISSLIRSECLTSRADSIYLCSGNYYQKEYLELINLLNDKRKCTFISTTLYNILKEYLRKDRIEKELYKFIAFTSSSHHILNNLCNNGVVAKADLILIDNYHDLPMLGKKLPHDLNNYEYVLFCDAISTGFLIKQVDDLLGEGSLKFIAVIADTIDPSFEMSTGFYEKYEKKIISLFKYPIKKYLRDSPEVQDHIFSESVIRINPNTNIPIALSVSETNPENIILTKNEFLDLIDYRHIKIGLLETNNTIHSYYFDTENIMKDIGIELLEKIFSKKNPSGQNCFIVETENLRILYPKGSDIRHLDFSKFKDVVLKDHSVEGHPLDRYNEDGWKFPHTTKYIGEIVNDNPVLILDDGSCSGDSLTQMINELSFYYPKNITVLSLIGRLLEHKREFLSTINRIKKGNREIEIEIYFGTNWHIPTYHPSDKPNIKERNRLSNVVNYSNTPSRIKKFASSIYKALEPKEKEFFVSHKYLPKIKGRNITPRKDLIQTRDEVGKVVGYRFYNENFEWFNYFIKKYESSDRNDRYKEIELLSAIISYEPYIYDKLRKILPDVTDKLCEFIDSVIFGNPRRSYKQLDVNNLHFEWDVRNFIHLFFVIYPNDELVVKLKERDNISRLLSFIEHNRISIDYLFYKFLNFFPLNSNEIVEKNPINILALLKTLPQDNGMNKDYLRQLNIFKAFVSSLPTKKDFNHQQLEISDALENLLKDEFHKTSLRAQLGYMLSDVETMNVNFSVVDLKKFHENWINISKFLAQILSFVKSYPSYLPRTVYDVADSISVVYGRLNELIPNLRSNSNFGELDLSLEKLRDSIFNSSSEIFKLFLNPITYNIVSIIETKIKEFDIDGSCRLDSKIDKDSKLAFPEYYFKEIILETILNNLRHRNVEKDPVVLQVGNSSDLRNIEIRMSNIVSDDYRPGTGYGSIVLDYANGFPGDVFEYTSNKNEDTYIQKIAIKKF